VTMDKPSVVDKTAETFRDKVLRKCGESVEMKEKFFATFCMFPSVKKKGLAKCITTSSIRSASVT